jgi:MarR family transcriptional regulator, organic hydroperoxide resistance regulator
VSNKLVLPPQRSLGHQVRRCHRMFDRLLSARLGRHHLNSGFWYYLRALWIQDGRTQKELSDVTNVRENTTVAMINLMIQNGFVERARDPIDRRKLRITLTPRGRRLEAELMHHAIEINAIAAAGISRGEIETCLSVLARASENLERALDHVPEDRLPKAVKPRGRRRRTTSPAEE